MEKKRGVVGNMFKELHHFSVAVGFISFLLISVVHVVPADAQPCDQCGRPRVALYDCDVQVPRPTIPDSIPKWWTLSFPMAVARGEFMNNDPTRTCMTFLDGAMINANELQGGTLQFGNEYENLPPDGPVNSADYLITGSVAGSNGNYTLNLELQTAISREVVKSQSANFSYDITSQQAAGASAGSSFIPLFNTIRDFEVNKRDEDVTVAIGNMLEISVKPQKNKVDTGEVIDVALEMIDCDGVPLSYRTIFFGDTTLNGLPLHGTTSGTIDPSVAITDGDGKATVKFKAGHQKGFANIVAWYPNIKPCGRQDVFMGSAIVAIEQPPPDLWFVDCTIFYEQSMTLDSSWSGSGYGTSWGGSNHWDIHTEGGARINAVIQNFAVEGEEFEFNAPLSEAEASSATGWYSDNEFTKHTEFLGSDPSGSQIRSDYQTGNAVPGSEWFEFRYTQDDKYVNAGIDCYQHGGYEGRWFGPPPEGGVDCWNDFNGVYDDSSGGVSDDGSSDDDWCTITKSDSGYQAVCSQIETQNEAYDAGTAIVSTTTVLTATIKPYSSLVNVSPNSDKTVPRSFSLSQNFPNPFNPSTTINYQVPKTSLVVLKVYDVLGREAATLVNETKSPGTYEAKFDGSKFASGIYFCRMTAGSYISAKKLMLIK